MEYPCSSSRSLFLKDIGALYDAHFDHRGAIKSELDAFVREHEVCSDLFYLFFVFFFPECLPHADQARQFGQRESYIGK
jgi:hypothetical protein